MLKKVFIAFSGGIDSTLLLFIQNISRVNSSIILVHINHNLNKLSQIWKKHCLKVATHINVELILYNLRVNRVNVQSWARKKRYTFLHNIFLQKKKNCIVYGTP